MPAKKRALGSDLKKIDRHVVQPHEYDEIPELTEEWFASVDHRRGGKLVRRGRPKSDDPKQLGSLPRCCDGSSAPAQDISRALAKFLGVMSGKVPHARRRRGSRFHNHRHHSWRALMAKLVMPGLVPGMDVKKFGEI